MKKSKTKSLYLTIGIILLLAVLGFALYKIGFLQETAYSPQAQGFGEGAKGNAPTQQSALGIPGTTTLGEYHSLNIDTKPYSIPSKTTFDLNNYMPIGSGSNSSDYAKVAGESWAQSRTEVIVSLIVFRNINKGGHIKFQYYKDKDSKLLYTFDYDIPSPSTKHYDYWGWYAVYAWVGHFRHEINEAGTYHVVITTDWGNQSFPFTIVNTCVPNWQIGPWGNCVNGIQSRAVEDLNHCGVLTNMPSSAQACGQCVPSYEENTCGIDNCNNNYDACLEGYTCEDSQCIAVPPACVPDCTNKICGEDGCGGSCGTCSINETCNLGICTSNVVCGNNLADTGETCSNCPQDVVCPTDLTCSEDKCIANPPIVKSNVLKIIIYITIAVAFGFIIFLIIKIIKLAKKKRK